MDYVIKYPGTPFFTGPQLKSADAVKWLRTHGIRTVITVYPLSDSARSELRKQKMRFRDLSRQFDRSVGVSSKNDDWFDFFSRFIRPRLMEWVDKGAVSFHCQAGIHKTPSMAVMAMNESGLNGRIVQWAIQSATSIPNPNRKLRQRYVHNFAPYDIDRLMKKYQEYGQKISVARHMPRTRHK